MAMPRSIQFKIGRLVAWELNNLHCLYRNKKEPTPMWYASSLVFYVASLSEIDFFAPALVWDLGSILRLVAFSIFHFEFYP